MSLIGPEILQRDIGIEDCCRQDHRFGAMTSPTGTATGAEDI
jgi:hypothetical protein